MNSNSKRRQAADRAQFKSSGFPKPVFKAKAKPFPRPNKDEDLSLTRQREIFYGLPKSA